MAILNQKYILRIAAVLTLIFISCPVSVKAQGSQEPVRLYEYKIKAGLVYNFLKYTSWPQKNTNTDKRLNVCLLGGDSFEGYLYPLSGRTAQQYEIEIKQIDDISEVKGCQIVFIHRSLEPTLPQVLASLRNKKIMTMSDIRRFSRRGGMVEFAVQKDKRIHIYINKTQLDRESLTVGERLIKLSETVE